VQAVIIPDTLAITTVAIRRAGAVHLEQQHRALKGILLHV